MDPSAAYAPLVGRIRAPAAWLLLTAAVLVASLFLGGAYPLVDPDEGRNAEVAREMAVSGDLLIPRLAGMPYLDKPPALFLAETFAFRVFGTTTRAARLPMALSAWATLVLVGRLASRHKGNHFALLAVSILAAAPLFAVLSAYVIFDMPLTLCVTAVWAGVMEEVGGSSSRSRRLCMFAATALGLLLKGPVMLAWILGGSLGAALLLKDRRSLCWLAWWPGWILVVLVAGGWFALATRRFPEYPHYAFLEESFERLTTGNFHRQQPLWFVPLVLIFGALPSSLATPWGGRLDSDRSRVAFGFVLFAAVFFSLSSSKLVTYLLPAFPMIAWLGAEAWSDPRRVRRGAVSVAMAYGALAILCGLASVRPGWLAFLAEPKLITLGHATALKLAPAWAVVGGIAACAAWKGWRNVPWIACFSFTPILFALGGPWLQAYASSQSGEPLARAIVARASSGTVRFEHCYSPGAEFVLRGRSQLVSPQGLETTSNYQARYRASLERRGLWTPLAAPPGVDSAVAVVRSVRDTTGRMEPGEEIYRDRRFVAYGNNLAAPEPNRLGLEGVVLPQSPSTR